MSSPIRILLTTVANLFSFFLFHCPGQFAGYNLEGYNDSAVLPKGFAALAATCVGTAGAVLGQSLFSLIFPSFFSFSNVK